jgi:HSP20 family protein
VDERRYGKVTRTVTLPESIDPESIAGKLTDGVLHVTVAKRPEAQPKRIEIS